MDITVTPTPPRLKPLLMARGAGPYGCGGGTWRDKSKYRGAKSDWLVVSPCAPAPPAFGCRGIPASTNTRRTPRAAPTSAEHGRLPPRAGGPGGAALRDPPAAQPPAVKVHRNWRGWHRATQRWCIERALPLGRGRAILARDCRTPPARLVRRRRLSPTQDSCGSGGDGGPEAHLRSGGWGLHESFSECQADCVPEVRTK